MVISTKMAAGIDVASNNESDRRFGQQLMHRQHRERARWLHDRDASPSGNSISIMETSSPCLALLDSFFVR